MSNPYNRFLRIDHLTSVAAMLCLIKLQWPKIRLSEVRVYSCVTNDEFIETRIESLFSYHVRIATRGLLPVEKKIIEALMLHENKMKLSHLTTMLESVKPKNMQKALTNLIEKKLISYNSKTGWVNFLNPTT